MRIKFHNQPFVDRIWRSLYLCIFKNASLFILPHENEAGRKAQLSAATS